MAVTFFGSLTSLWTYGNNDTTQNICVFENGIASRVNVNIRRFVLQNDSVAPLAAVMPIVKVSRISSLSGGVLKTNKATFDTTQTSDTNVRFWVSENVGSGITATAGDTIWQQYGNRMRTAIEQQQGDDKNALPLLIADSGKEFVLRPGQMLLVQVTAAATTSNAHTTTNWWTEIAWEEDSVSTFSISGTVTQGGSPVVGAKVYVMEAQDHSLTNALLHEVVTTIAGGAWSSTIRSGWVGAAFVQYDNGGTLYTAPGSPFLEGA